MHGFDKINGAPMTELNPEDVGYTLENQYLLPSSSSSWNSLEVHWTLVCSKCARAFCSSRAALMNILFTVFGIDEMDVIHIYPVKLSIFVVILEIICTFMTSQ